MLMAQNVDLGEAREEIPIDMDGAPVATGFNVKYFQDILGATRGDHMTLQLGESLDPCIVRMVDQDNNLFVVMPMRLD